MNNNKVIMSSFLWRFFERCGAQGVTFIVSIILARLLDTKLYGIIALVTVFTSIMQVFVDSGMGNALIQKKDADDLDFSTVFYFNIFMCSVLYFIMFIIAPIIAEFYDMHELTRVIRVLSLILIISGVKNVLQAYVSRNMLFKRFFFSTLGGTIGAAIVGILMAYLGYGIWALVFQMIFNNAVDTIILWFTVKWRPKLFFSIYRLKKLFSYGWKMLLSSLIDTVYRDLTQLIIGKRYSSADLAQYNQGQKFPLFFVTNINSSIDSVLLPTMSKVQDELSVIKNITRRSIKISTYIMMPFMVGLAVCAEPFISFILTDKWLPCVPFLRIFCFSYAFYPIHTANLNAIKAMGRSDLFLKLEIIKKIIGLISIFISMHISVKAMAYSLIITSITSQIINSWPNKKLMDYSYLEQLRDIVPQIVLSILMGGIVYSVNFIGFNNLFTLILQLIIGTIIYICGSFVFKIDSFMYVSSILSNFFNNKSKYGDAK